MKYIFLTICFAICAFGFSTPTNAQKPRKAKKLYENFGYKSSIPLLEEMIEKGKMNEENVSKIANSYRLIHDTENAEKWYKELVLLSDNPIHFCYYCIILLMIKFGEKRAMKSGSNSRSKVNMKIIGE